MDGAIGVLACGVDVRVLRIAADIAASNLDDVLARATDETTRAVVAEAKRQLAHALGLRPRAALRVVETQ